MLLFADGDKLPEPWQWELGKAAIGSIISAVIAAIVAYFVAVRNSNVQQRLSLDALQNKAIELAMQYPHLENKEYCDAWPNPPGNKDDQKYKDDRERYDNYCCFIFNMIRQAWEFTGGKLDGIDDALAVKEYVIMHRCWWKAEDGNIHYYTQEFRNFVNGVIDDEKRVGGCGK